MDSTLCVLQDSPAHHLVTYCHAGNSDFNSGRRNVFVKLLEFGLFHYVATFECTGGSAGMSCSIWLAENFGSYDMNNRIMQSYTYS
jgi:hypothetical protein